MDADEFSKEDIISVILDESVAFSVLKGVLSSCSEVVAVHSSFSLSPTTGVSIVTVVGSSSTLPMSSMCIHFSGF